MFTVDQIVCHFIGDYIFQSDWEARSKRHNTWAAWCHATTYMLPFLLVKSSWLALFVMMVSHFLIDRFGLARYLVWLKNGPLEAVVDPETMRETVAWKPITETGYPLSSPPWLATWLFIIADNIIHVIINALAITYL